MKIEILSDGTPKGTKILYRGIQLPGVQQIDVNMTPGGISATVEFIDINLDFYDIKSNVKEKNFSKQNFSKRN